MDREGVKMMGEHKLGHKVRDAIKAANKKRLNRKDKIGSKARALVRPGAHRSLSTRGEQGDTWNTKRHTPARIRMRDEALENRERQRKMAADKAAKAKDKAKFVEREENKGK
jgi:hypothetical protein